MSELRDLLDDVVADADALFLFSPSGSFYERFEDLDDAELVVVAPENAVDSDAFVELPSTSPTSRAASGSASRAPSNRGFVDEEADVVCVADVFGEQADTITRVQASDFSRSGVYDLFVNSRAETRRHPRRAGGGHRRARQEGPEGQTRRRPVRRRRRRQGDEQVPPAVVQPPSKSHVHVGDPIVNVMLKEFSPARRRVRHQRRGENRLRVPLPRTFRRGRGYPKGLGARHMAASAITRDTNAIAIVLSESDGLVRGSRAAADPGVGSGGVLMQFDWPEIIRTIFSEQGARSSSPLLILVTGAVLRVRRLASDAPLAVQNRASKRPSKAPRSNGRPRPRNVDGRSGLEPRGPVRLRRLGAPGAQRLAAVQHHYLLVAPHQLPAEPVRRHLRPHRRPHRRRQEAGRQRAPPQRQGSGGRVLPELVKYSIFYLAALVALAASSTWQPRRC